MGKKWKVLALVWASVTMLYSGFMRYIKDAMVLSLGWRTEPAPTGWEMAGSPELASSKAASTN